MSASHGGDVLRGVSVLATPARPAYPAYPYFIEKHVFSESWRSCSGSSLNQHLTAGVRMGFSEPYAEWRRRRASPWRRQMSTSRTEGVYAHVLSFARIPRAARPGG